MLRFFFFIPLDLSLILSVYVYFFAGYLRTQYLGFCFAKKHEYKYRGEKFTYCVCVGLEGLIGT
jgi:hypothetical protein